MSKAFRLYETGVPEVLRWEDVDVGEPGTGQVRIRNTAVAVNFIDIYLRRGQNPIKSFPCGMGLESAGVIDAIGPEVDGLAVGDRVACVCGVALTSHPAPVGAYAEQRIVPAARVVPLPGSIDERTAASMMIKGMTARYLLRETYRVKAGDVILIHAAAGGCGLILCQWAKHLGATVIGTVGTHEKAEIARAHGCDHAIVYTMEDFVERVRVITAGKGVDVVYDSVGKATFEGSLHCLRKRGLLVSYGESSGSPDAVAPRRLGHLGSIYLTHPGLPDYTATRSELLATANDLFAMVGSGKIRMGPSRTYPLRDAPRAHADLESRKTTGSIVLVV